MKTTKKISIAAICSGVLLSALTLRSAPPARDDDQSAWRAEPQNWGEIAQAGGAQAGGDQRGAEFHRMRGNAGGGPREQLSPVDGDPHGAGGPPPPPRGYDRDGGPPPPPPQGYGDGMDGQDQDRSPRRLMQLRGEINRIKQNEKDVDRLDARVNDKDFAAKLTPDQLDRKTKIVSLRKDLNNLEEKDLVDRVKSESDKTLKQLTDLHSDPDTPPERVEILADMIDHVKKVNAAATDFKTLSAAMDTMGSPMQDGGGQAGDERMERVRREMDMLSKRMDDLRMDLQDMGAGSGTPGGGSEAAGPGGRRQRMDGGQDGAPPRGERQRGNRRPPRPEDGPPPPPDNDGGGQPPPPPPPPPQS